MNRCCSTHQAQRYRRRLNGIQCPLNYLQVIGWIAVSATTLINFLILINIQFEDLKLISEILYSVLYVIHIVFHGFALFLDPGEYELRQKERNAVPEFDRTIHAHVIENGRCHLCNINTSNRNTKHCGICNKCVYYFDHHCKWLNNCVGSRNYTAFILCVLSALLISVLTSLLCVTDIVFFIKTPESLSKEAQKFTDCSHAPELTKYCSNSIAFLTFLVIYCVTGFLIACSLLRLLCFHIYIAILGVSTYEFILRNRQNKPQQHFCKNNHRSNYLIAMNNLKSDEMAGRTNYNTEFIEPGTKTLRNPMNDDTNRPRKVLLYSNSKIHPKPNEEMSF